MSKKKLLIYIIIIMFSFFNKTMSIILKTFFDLNINSINGDVLNLSKLKGKTILLVNVASKCGFTKQYDDLQNFMKVIKIKACCYWCSFKSIWRSRTRLRIRN